MAGGFSRYTPAIVQFAQATRGAAVYCFVVDGELGTGGMPIVSGFPPPEEYRRRCEELIALLRRSADLLEKDIARAESGTPLGSVDR